MKFDFRKIFVIISAIFLSFMVSFYGYRLVHFYLKEKEKDTTSYTMIAYLTKEENLINNKLIKEENRYYFPKDAQNNYLYFSGLMYRILYMDDKTIYAITDQVVTNLKYGITSDYNASNIKVWMNEVFLNNLHKDYLNSEEVRLINKELYQKIGANESSIIGKDMWVLDDNEGLVLTEDGNLMKPTNYEDFLGIKPVIELNGTKKYIAGKGTVDEPYLFEERGASTLNDLAVGDYLTYKGMDFRLIEKNATGVKVLSVNKLDNQLAFSDKSNVYQTNNKKALGYYLNSTYLGLLNQDDLVLTKWYTGDYHFDYKETLSSGLNAYVGLLKIGDYFITDVLNSYLLTRSGSYVYTINSNGDLSLSSPTKALDIYPVLTLKSDLNVGSGLGYIDNPYVVGE